MNSRFQLLHCVTNQAEWDSLIDRLPNELRDVHYTSAYNRIWTRTFGSQIFLAALSKEDAILVAPFQIKQVQGPKLSQFEANEISTPYGFSGPLFWGASSPSESYREFAEALHFWALSNKVASEFTLIHPLMPQIAENLRTQNMSLSFEKKVVVIDLEPEFSRIRSTFNRGCKSNLARSEKSGICVDQVPATGQNLERFHQLYWSTMERHQAKKRWFFPQAFWEETFSNLGGRASLLVARRGDVWLGAYVLIRDDHRSYYHFAGSTPEGAELRAPYLLMREAIVWAQSAGCKWLHLGGGTTSGDDSLMRFKSSFSKETRSLYSLRRIHDSSTYFALARASGAAEENSFFPAYRDGMEV